MSSLRR